MTNTYTEEFFSGGESAPDVEMLREAVIAGPEFHRTRYKSVTPEGADLIASFEDENEESGQRHVSINDLGFEPVEEDQTKVRVIERGTVIKVVSVGAALIAMGGIGYAAWKKRK